MRFRRSDRLPDEVRAALPMQPGERVIAVARLRAAGWAVATERALVMVEERVDWTDVGHAQWHAEEQVLAVDRVGSRAALRLELTEPGLLPETVHERVMASIVVSRRVALPGGGARLVARRGAGSDETVWQVVPDRGTDLADPLVRSRVDAALADLQGELG